jgi:hypothetical protein
VGQIKPVTTVFAFDVGYRYDMRASKTNRNILSPALLLALFLTLPTPIGASTSPAYATAGTGAITIVATGGTAVGTNWTFSSGVLTTVDATSASVPVSAVIDYLNAGNLTVQATNITVDGNVIATSGNFSLTLKATNDISLAAGRSITTLGGAAIFWADSDATGDTTTAGGDVRFNEGSSLQTAGGNIVIAGGLDNGANGGTSSDQIPDGYIFGQELNNASVNFQGGGNAGTAAVLLDTTTINAGSGSVLIRGNGTGNGINFQMGVWLEDVTITGHEINIFAKGSAR